MSIRGRCSNVDTSSEQRFHSFAETGDVGEGERETFLAVVPERLRKIHRKPRDCVAGKGDPDGLHCRTGAPGCAPGQTGCHHRTEHYETRRGFQHYYRTVLLETVVGRSVVAARKHGRTMAFVREKWLIRSSTLARMLHRRLAPAGYHTRNG